MLFPGAPSSFRAASCARSDVDSDDSFGNARTRDHMIACSKGKPTGFPKDNEVQKFMKRFAQPDQNGTYKIKNLKDWFEGQNLRVDFTNRGEIIISGFEFPIPDLAARHEADYKAKLKLINENSNNIGEKILKNTTYNNTFTAMALIVLLIFVFIFMAIMYWTRESS
jgi:hypothetical protein